MFKYFASPFASAKFARNSFASTEKELQLELKYNFQGKKKKQKPINHRYCLPLSALKSRGPESFMADIGRRRRRSRERENGDSEDANESKGFGGK